jgi:hypothetical protein
MLPCFGELPIWQQHIISAIKSLEMATSLKQMNMLRPYIPYVVHPTQLPDTFILLNRDYKPLGLNARGFRFEYEQYAHLHLSVSEVGLMADNFFRNDICIERYIGAYFYDGDSPFTKVSDIKPLAERLINSVAAQYGVSAAELVEAYSLGSQK